MKRRSSHNISPYIQIIVHVQTVSDDSLQAKVVQNLMFAYQNPCKQALGGQWKPNLHVRYPAQFETLYLSVRAPCKVHGKVASREGGGHPLEEKQTGTKKAARVRRPVRNFVSEEKDEIHLQLCVRTAVLLIQFRHLMGKNHQVQQYFLRTMLLLLKNHCLC